MSRSVLNVATIHRNLRAARYQQRHCEGATSDQIQIRYNDEELQIKYADFMALAEALRDAPLGPEINRENLDF